MKNQLLLMALCVFNLTSDAQDTSRLHRVYATQEFMKGLLTGDSLFTENRSAIERSTAEYMIQGIPDTISIPLVFHLIGDGGADISSEDIEIQLESLNRDFFLPQYTPEDSMNGAWIAEFSDNAAIPLIRFCIATVDPSGNPASGVLYVPSDSTIWSIGTNIMDGGRGGSYAWEPSKYLNIWVAPLMGDKAGYAQMPGGPSQSDGVVLNYKYFQRDSIPPVPTFPYSRYLKGRTLVHLIGSYLNLYELWSEYEQCGDDYLHDTPVHNAPNYTMPAYPHVSTCGENPIEMTINMMDNVDDEAQFMFTHGQVMRMQSLLTKEGGYRSGLSTLMTYCGSSDTSQLAELIATRSGTQPNNITLSPQDQFNVSVFPNPAADAFTVIILSECEDKATVNVLSPLGVLQFTRDIELRSKSVSINIPSKTWASGTYAVQVICGSEIASAKLILQK